MSIKDLMLNFLMLGNKMNSGKDIDKIMAIEHSNTSSTECENLYSLALNIKDGCIVEIGSYHGRTSAALALAVQANGLSIPVFCIEPHD